MIEQRTERAVRFEGAVNVRDLGGIPVGNRAITRFGVIYRGDGLVGLSDADLERFSALGIRSIVDLRSEDERAKAPDRLPLHEPPEIHACGFLPQGSIEMFHGVNELGADGAAAFELMRSNYARIPFEHTAEFSEVLHFLLEHERMPHFIHCSFGKDRTGLVAAFILLALGVSVEEVVVDFEMTKVAMDNLDIFDPRAKPDAIEAIMAAPAGYLLASLNAIDEHYGEFNGYLSRALKFGPQERQRLAELMLVPV
ncbi:MAG: tyrosine-protein phosphatase [Proteobacteria bacterium]|nr:tyrosine-protein phosphatase [Pseudomonadota bacterium]